MTTKTWVLVLIYIGFTVSNGFTVSVSASREKCFHQIASEGQKIFGSFAVQLGGKLDINIRINDPENQLIFEATEKSSDSFEFIAPKNGRYELCFNNQKTSVSTKRLSFNFHVSNEITNKGLHVSSLVYFFFCLFLINY